MGKLDNTNFVPFTSGHIKNKQLVLSMLQYEDNFGKSDRGLNFYRTNLLQPRHTLNAIYAVHKCVLSHFGFDTSNESVTNYREIFRNYYKSPTDYDNDVISSVYYMRGNKCIFYNKHKLIEGELMIDCNLLNLNGEKTTLFDELNKYNSNYYIVGAFSNS